MGIKLITRTNCALHKQNVNIIKAIYGSSRLCYVIFASLTNCDKAKISFFFVEDMNYPLKNTYAEGG